MKKEFQVNKWRIELEERTDKKVWYWVKVYNTNAKKEWNRLMPKYSYSFTTLENAQKWVMDFVKREKDWEAIKLQRREERKKRDHSQDLTTVVKRALSEKYGYKNVKVNRGRGTASGWVEARVMIPEKAPSCENDEQSIYGRCYTCSQKITDIRNEAEKIAYSAVSKAGLSFGHYYSDDGYGTKRSEFLLDIRFQ